MSLCLQAGATTWAARQYVRTYVRTYIRLAHAASAGHMHTLAPPHPYQLSLKHTTLTGETWDHCHSRQLVEREFSFKNALRSHMTGLHHTLLQRGAHARHLLLLHTLLVSTNAYTQRTQLVEESGQHTHLHAHTETYTECGPVT